MTDRRIGLVQWATILILAMVFVQSGLYHGAPQGDLQRSQKKCTSCSFAWNLKVRVTRQSG